MTSRTVPAVRFFLRSTEGLPPWAHLPPSARRAASASLLQADRRYVPKRNAALFARARPGTEISRTDGQSVAPERRIREGLHPKKISRFVRRGTASCAL